MEFSALIDMVQTVTRNKIKNIEVLGNPDQKGNLVETFYDAIAKGKVDSDEAAVHYLYGHTNKKDAAYQRLKNRLIRQLINTVFFIDTNQPQFSDRLKALCNCYRDFSAAYILLARGADKPAVKILEQILEQCLKFQFTELTAEITRFLRTFSGRLQGNQQKTEHYAFLHREHEAKRYAEMKALDYYENLLSYYIAKRSPNQDIHKLASKYYDELTPLLSETGTAQFYYNYCQIGIIKYLSIDDCYSVIKIIDEALPKLQGLGIINRGRLFTIAIQKLACLIQLRLLTDGVGDEIAQYCLSISQPGEFNWFRTQEIYFYYCSYGGRYQDALYIYIQVKKSPRLSLLEGNWRDYWHLLGGYLHLLASFKQLDVDKVVQIAGPFGYAKFANNIEILDKDKEGMNIPLLLLPILYNLAKGNLTGAIPSIEALDKYRKRYLNNEINQRSNSFVKMLMAYAELPYKKVVAEKKIQKELALLKISDPQVVGQSFAVEIIPYEDLWSMLTNK